MKTTVKVRQRRGKWIYEPMIRGTRKPMVDLESFALGRQLPRPRSATTAAMLAGKVLAEWQAGKDPRQTPAQQAAPVTAPPTVTDLVRAYQDFYVPAPDAHGRQVKPLRLKQPQVVRSELKHITGYCGHWLASDLEHAEQVGTFTTALYEGWSPNDELVERGESGVLHLLRRLRTVINWGMYQRPAFLARTPFHRHGIKLANEDTRTRRLRTVRDGQPWDEEAALLAACAKVDDPDHQFAGRQIRRRLLGALETAGRGSELDRLRVSDLVLTKTAASLTFAGRSRRGGKAKDPRAVPFDPQGALAESLRPRLFLKPPHDFLFGDEEGRRINHYKAWLTVRLLAWGYITADGKDRTPAGDQAALKQIDLEFRDLRRECASRWWQNGVDVRKIQILLGHSTLAMTQRYLQLPVGGSELRDALASAMAWNGTAKGRQRNGHDS